MPWLTNSKWTGRGIGSRLVDREKPTDLWRVERAESTTPLRASSLVHLMKNRKCRPSGKTWEPGTSQ